MRFVMGVRYLRRIPPSEHGGDNIQTAIYLSAVSLFQKNREDARIPGKKDRCAEDDDDIDIQFECILSRLPEGARSAFHHVRTSILKE